MWEEKENTLYRKFVFNNFIEAFAFMTKVAILAEKHNHHPTWKNTWNTVEIWLQPMTQVTLLLKKILNFQMQ